jgi:nucleoid-associated protein YgaU
MTLTKAYLEFYEPSSHGEKSPTSVHGKSRLEFQFNPREMSVQKSAEWKRDPAVAAQSAATAAFTGAGPRQLSVELFLDATTTPDAKRDVVDDVETLLACVVPLPQTLPKTPSPPFVRFGWGKVHLLAFVKTVSAKYTLFRPDGTPIRALCTVSLEEVPSYQKKQNPTSGSLAPLRSHTMVAGDSLTSLAYAEYGDPTQWRRLAEANAIEDPLGVPSGRRIFVPASGNHSDGRD